MKKTTIFSEELEAELQAIINNREITSLSELIEELADDEYRYYDVIEKIQDEFHQVKGRYPSDEFDNLIIERQLSLLVYKF